MKTHHRHFETDKHNRLTIQNIPLDELARTYGTPLFVLDEDVLAQNARTALHELRYMYSATASIHFPMKCNSVPAVVQTMRNEGLNVEVMTEFELHLARSLGYSDAEIIVNGPCKTRSFLRQCLTLRLIIIDSLSELRDLIDICREEQTTANCLLRVNPDYTPQGMNSGSATASRRGSVFGLDLKTGEVKEAISLIQQSTWVVFKGLHIHIGTGVRHPVDYLNALRLLKPLVRQIYADGLRIDIMDTGGGYATANSRELTTMELLMYQAFHKCPTPLMGNAPRLTDFLRAINGALRELFDGYDMPELIIEPGRSLVSNAQCLLLGVHRIKHRVGAGRWAITDGGIGTMTMPTYYEYHEVLLCNDTRRKGQEKVTLSGPCCFSEDIVYKNKVMPPLREGDVLAIMDCGAYFNQWESNFGFARAPIVGVQAGVHRALRTRESFDEMLARDRSLNSITERENNEIRCYS